MLLKILRKKLFKTPIRAEVHVFVEDWIFHHIGNKATYGGDTLINYGQSIVDRVICLGNITLAIITSYFDFLAHLALLYPFNDYRCPIFDQIGVGGYVIFGIVP